MRRSVYVLVAALAVTLAACSSDDGGGGTTAPGGSQTGTTTAATGTTTAATGTTGDGCADLTGEGSDFTVTMGDDYFEPDCLMVSAVQGIHVVNEGIGQHTLTIDDSQVDVLVLGGEEFNGEAVGTVLEPGDHQFYCRFHGSMLGEITVVE